MILDDIRKLRRTGVPLKDIVVNDGDDRLGETCATTRAIAQEIINGWEPDGQDDITTIDDLQTAEDWLAQKGGA